MTSESSAPLEIPVHYVDIGKYFSGGCRIILHGDTLISWIQHLPFDQVSHANDPYFYFGERLGLQFHLNGLTCFDIFYHEPNSYHIQSFVKGLKNHGIQVIDVFSFASNISLEELRFYLEGKCHLCPLLLSIQNYLLPQDIHFILTCGISTALLSERILLPGERLHSFLYLTTPNAANTFTMTGEESLHQQLKTLSISNQQLGDNEKSLPTTLVQQQFTLTPIESHVLNCIDFTQENSIPHSSPAQDIFMLKSYVQKKEDLEAYEEVKEERKRNNNSVAQAREEKYALKKVQIFYSRVHFHATSLQGAQNLYRPIVLASPSTNESGSTSPLLETKALPPKQKPSKNVVEKKSKAQLIKEENEKRLLEAELVKQKSILATAVENMNNLRSVNEKLAILDNLKISTQGSTIRAMEVAFILAKLDVYINAWKEDLLNRPGIASSTTDADFINALLALEQIFLIYDDYLDALTMDQLEASILSSLLMFGFIEAAELFVQAYIQKQPGHSSNVLKKLQVLIKNLSSSIGKYKIKMSWTRFQLLFCGHLFPRSLNAKSDPRVLFKPDAWQVQLLDAVDRNESALICAPTSSGKTFICFYAMVKPF